MWTPDIPALGNDWREVLNRHERAVVFFWATWSPPDRMFAPVLKRVAPEFAGRLELFSADLDEKDKWELALFAGVMTNPQIVLFRSGEVDERMIGGLNTEQLRAFLEKWANR